MGAGVFVPAPGHVAISPCTDVTAPAFSVNPTLNSGIGLFTYTGGVADEPCVHNVQMVKGAETQLKGYTTNYITGVAGTSPALSAGDWDVSFKLKDVCGNISNWIFIGTVTVFPDF